MLDELVRSLDLSSKAWVNAIILFGLFVIAAKIADLFVDKIVRRLTKFTESDLDDKIIDIVHRPVFYSILLIGAAEAIEFLKPAEKTLFMTDSLLYTIIVIVWVVTAIKAALAVIRDAFTRVADMTGLGKDVLPLLENTVKVVIIVAGLMFVLSIWKINLTPLLASAGIAGVAVAMAAKDTLANLFGGISIFMDKPYKIGDIIVLDGKDRGEVIEIGVRSTRVKTVDDVLITIPNSIISNTKVVNESAPTPMMRLRIPICVAYGTDIDLAERLLITAADETPDVLKTPAPKARFRQFGDSALSYELFCWIKDPSLAVGATHELNRAIYKKFASEGVKIPFPQREIHVIKEQ